MEGKKCFLYFSEITPARITMKNIIFSTPLLQVLGCDIKNIAIDFLKYKHVFFEVFSTKNYAFFMEKCLDTFAELQKKLIENPSLMK